MTQVIICHLKMRDKPRTQLEATAAAPIFDAGTLGSEIYCVFVFVTERMGVRMADGCGVRCFESVMRKQTSRIFRVKKFV
jgi:hypothetical protein